MPKPFPCAYFPHSDWRFGGIRISEILDAEACPTIRGIRATRYRTGPELSYPRLPCKGSSVRTPACRTSHTRTPSVHRKARAARATHAAHGHPSAQRPSFTPSPGPGRPDPPRDPARAGSASAPRTRAHASVRVKGATGGARRAGPGRGGAGCGARRRRGARGP